MEKMGRDRKGEQAAAAVDETGNRESQGCQMSSKPFCRIVIELFLVQSRWNPCFPFQRRSMERKERRRSMELRASLSLEKYSQCGDTDVYYI